MRNRLEKLLRWPWLPLIFLCAVASWAFLMRGSLPRQTDAELHVFRTAELAYALRAGVLYPRWAPHFYYGYGYPIFNYYAPLTYYLANVFALANPAWAVFGTKAVFVSGLWLGGIGAYGFTRRWAGHMSGLVAAAAFLYAPYVMITGPHLRGVLAESFTVGLLAVVLWGAAAHADRPRPLTLVWCSGGLAALMLSHNIIGPVGFALVAGYMAWRVLWGEAGVVRMVAPVLLGAGLSAFFWLNVFLEADAVQLGNLVGPGNFNYRNHFLTVRDLIFGPGAVDLGAVNPPFQLYAGWAALLLAVAGALTLLRSGDHAREASYFMLAGGGLAFLTLQVSQFVWDTLPLMAFIQFPWRLLGPLALCLAVLGGLAVRWVPDERWRGLLLALPLAGALGFFIPPGWGEFGPTGRVAMLEFELDGVGLGTTATGDFVPVEVDVVPGPIETVIASFYEEGPVDRVNRVALAEGAEVTLLRDGPTRHVYTVASPDGFTLRLYHFDFAGWKAAIDGQQVPIETAKPEGWITVWVPPGEHEVSVWLGATPARTLTAAISGVALVGLLVGAVWLERPPPPPDRHNEATHNWLPITLLVTFAAIGGAGVFQPSSTGNRAQPAQVDTLIRTDTGINLIGYSLSDGVITPGGQTDLTLYWKTETPLSENYQVFVHVTTTPDNIWVQSDKLNPSGFPTTRWPTDQYVRDEHPLALPADIAPGTYTLRVGIYDRSDGSRAQAVGPDGTVLGGSITLDVPLVIRERGSLEALLRR